MADLRSGPDTVIRSIEFSAEHPRATVVPYIKINLSMVRAGGLEPSRGYPQQIFLPATAFAALPVCGAA